MALLRQRSPNRLHPVRLVSAQMGGFKVDVQERNCKTRVNRLKKQKLHRIDL